MAFWLAKGMKTVSGNPDPRHANARKKVENHAAAVALHFIHYNFARAHEILRITPAMAAGISDHIWRCDEIAELVDQL
jgi:hypothetical protein